MIPDKKDWVLRQLRRMKQNCIGADSNGTKIYDYGKRIKLVDMISQFVENQES